MELKTLPRPIKAEEFEGWPTDRFIAAPGHPLSEGWKGMGPLAASTRVHECSGHLGPCLGLGWFPIHGFSSKKGNEPLGPAKRTQELYGLAAKSLESVTS